LIKKVHFIWLGSELPSKNKEIVAEWKELLPDFEFFLWNEENTKKYDCLFLRQCIRKKAYAFAADYLRLKIVNEYGGFYLDTDMKLIKSLNDLEVGSFMIGEQEENIPNWGIFYSEKNSMILNECLSRYENLCFDQFKPPVIPYFLKEFIHQGKNIKIYPPSVFYPMPQGVDVSLYEEYIGKNTIGVHLWDFSWKKLKKERSKIVEVLYRLIQLVKDVLYFDYPLHYFNINFIRILRLLKVHA
jgi:mannosyltransferase OCH1-like enzyme